MADDVERYLTEDEVRAENRRLSGVAIRYGDTAQSHRERFEAGSLRLDSQVILDWEHDAMRALAWSPSGGLELVDAPDAMRMTAELPPLPAADKALEEVRAGRVTGLSIRFRPVRERMGERYSDYRGSAVARHRDHAGAELPGQPRPSPFATAPHMALKLSPWPPDTSVAARDAARACLRAELGRAATGLTDMQIDRLGGAAAC